MFFEGSEKKAEIIINDDNFSLLTDINDEFWQAFVGCCNAKILSTISNKYCKAFLLSESSLFVWQDRLLILTCGVTTLVNSIEYFLQNINSGLIKQVIYQRKNEYFAHAQLSCFGDDTKVLSKHFDGKAYRFGEMDSHHNYIFHQNNDYKAAKEDKSYGFLAYQISQKASKVLMSAELSNQNIRDFFQINNLLPDFLIDDFVFSPYGYSLNAIKGDRYLTIHVTPQTLSSYVSVESNLNLIDLTPQFLAILQPASFDLLSLNEYDFEVKVPATISNEYTTKALVKKQLSNDYFVCFASFIKPQEYFTEPVSLDLSGGSHAL